MKTCCFSVTEYLRTCWYKCLDQQALMQPMAAQLATEFINRSVHTRLQVLAYSVSNLCHRGCFLHLVLCDFENKLNQGVSFKVTCTYDANLVTVNQ